MPASTQSCDVGTISEGVVSSMPEMTCPGTMQTTSTCCFSSAISFESDRQNETSKPFVPQYGDRLIWPGWRQSCSVGMKGMRKILDATHKGGGF